MLVLSRRRGEAVRIKVGDTVIFVKIADVVGDRIKLGIEAPREVNVLRAELIAKYDPPEADPCPTA